jgi:hypothetical protein
MIRVLRCHDLRVGYRLCRHGSAYFGATDSVDPVAGAGGAGRGFLEQLERELPTQPWRPRLAIHCGRQDHLYAFNQQLVAILQRHKVQVTVAFPRGEHNFEAWRPMLAAGFEDVSRWFGRSCPR